jgi:amidophosphoribosyltransferase
MCGVLGIIDTEQVIGKMYNAMLTLQHRGQDSSGILTYDGRYHIKKGNGLVRDIFDEKNIARLRGHVAIGHTRYPTVGEGSVEDAQPFWINYPYGIAAAHNGNVSNFIDLKKRLFENSHKLINSNCDVEVIINIFAEYLEKWKNKPLTPEIVFNAVRYVYRFVKGSYSVVLYIADRGLVAFRDPFGLRPLVYGKRPGDKGKTGYAFASESVALDAMGFVEHQDVEPGAAIFIDADHAFHSKKISRKPFRPCIFEYIYFARPDSTMNGINVYESRIRLGARLAKKIRETPLDDIDIVVPVPDSARSAAIEIARFLRLRYEEGLVKNRYIGRTFIMPGNVIRRQSIRHKLNPIRHVFKDQNVLLVDDSIVRGNTSKSIIQMVRDAGAKKVYFASYSAPLTFPCVYGIDMQTKGEFIAVDADNQEIARKIGADAVVYQSIEDMENAVRQKHKEIKSFCKACFTGDYPTGDVSRDMLEKIADERRDSQKE